MNKGINQEYLDRNIDPAEDFYMFVNGGWMRSTEIPDDRSSWGSFHELSRDTDKKVLGLLDEELKKEGPASNKAARLFESGMNIQQIEKAKLQGISSILKEIETLGDISSLAGVLGLLAAKGLSGFIHFSVHPDLGNSKQYAAYLEPGSLGLPERDFYLETDEKALKIRDKYLAYVQYILSKEANYTSEAALTAADKILSFETDLAKHMLPKEERRQIELLYNPHSYTEINNKYPGIAWDLLFRKMDIDPPNSAIVTEPAFFEFLSEYIPQVHIDTIRDYLVFMVIHHVAPYTHSSLEQMHFDLFTRTLEGTDVMRPRRERIIKVINLYLGEALGQLFVSRYFPATAKATALEMVGDIVAAFGNRINRLEWMSGKTKSYALEKLEAFRVKIGYPDVWKDYSDLHLSKADEEGSYLQDLLSAIEWKFKKDTKRIEQEVDREEWFMAPQVVNAYYNPMFNEIVFPAAILQPPFFDWEADAAINYGGIGAVIGHEITHGFDDQGSRFDKEGNLNEWWSAEDRERFKKLSDQLVDQFNAYYPFEDLPLNGAFTLGENIADLGGLSVAYDALQLYYGRHGKPDRIDGFTPDQRFFMSWATVWRTKTRPEALRTQIKTDPHPPGMYRAVAAPSNLDHFYGAFEILPGSPWYRKAEERIKIW